jgi:hypothetical protein
MAKSNARLTDTELATMTSRLHHPHARERAAAAKRLRRLRDPRAGAALLDALHQEIPGPVPPQPTWEVQFELVMALGWCAVTKAEPFLRDLAQREFESTMVYVGLGDALTRLGMTHAADAGPLLWCESLNRPEVLDGAFKAVALLRVVFDEGTTAQLLALPGLTAAVEPVNTWRFWPAAAAAGWKGQRWSRSLNPARRVNVWTCAKQRRAALSANTETGTRLDTEQAIVDSKGCRASRTSTGTPYERPAIRAGGVCPSPIADRRSGRPLRRGGGSQPRPHRVPVDVGLANAGVAQTPPPPDGVQE